MAEESNQTKVDRFNEKFPVGKQVVIRKDSGELFYDTIKSPATVLGGHTPIAWLTRLGSYAISRVHEIPRELVS